MLGEKVVSIADILPPVSLDGRMPRFQAIGGAIKVTADDFADVNRSNTGFCVDVWGTGKLENPYKNSGVSSFFSLPREGLRNGDGQGFVINVFPDVVLNDVYELASYFAQINPDVPPDILGQHIKSNMPYTIVDESGIRFGTLKSGDLFKVNSDGLLTMVLPENLPRGFLEESKHDDVLKYGARLNLVSPWIIYEKLVAGYSNPDEPYDKYIVDGIRYKLGADKEIMMLVERAYKKNVWDPDIIPELIRPYVFIINGERKPEEVD